MSFTHGMDIVEMRGVASALTREVSSMNALKAKIDQLVNEAIRHWNGPDTKRFSQEWQSTHRGEIERIQRSLQDTIQKLNRNIDAQDTISNTDDGAGSSGGPGGGPTQGGPTGGGGGGGGGGGWGPQTGTPGGPETSIKQGAGVSNEKDRPTMKDKDGNDREKKWGTPKPESKDGWKPKATLIEGKVSDNVSLAEAQGRTKADLGNGVTAEAGGYAKAGTLEYEAKGGLYNTDKGLELSGEASAAAYLAKVGVDGKIGNDVISAQGKADAMVGAEAKVNGKLNREGLSAGGEVFLGGKATAEGSVNIGGVKPTVGGEVSYGIGAKADVHAGMVDGKLKFGGEVGATLGLGGSIKFDVEIDPVEVTNNLKKLKFW